jgi:solute:Na+ symporter, SSS family
LSDISLDLVFASVLQVVLLLVIGAFARQARRERTFGDYFLAGRSLGPIVVLFTIFATQYSGNAFSGIPGQTYREGLSVLMSVTFGVALVAGFTLFAPTLFRVSRDKQLVTPTDFLHYRYGSPWVSHLATAVFVSALLNFLLAQLMALGQSFDALTDGQIPYWTVVVGGGAVVLAYTVMGGMRAVAWTDVFQGIVMVVGLVVVVLLLWVEVGSPVSVVRSMNLLRPELVAAPTWRTCSMWLSNILLLTLGAPLYPQAIQRIFAARNLRAIRTALGAMALVPLIVFPTAVFIGAAGSALFPQLDRMTADSVTFLVVRYLVESDTLAYYPALLVMVAIISAIMSTADSCLLSLSSIITKDIVKARHRDVDRDSRLPAMVPVISALVILTVIALGIRPRMTLWGLLIIKFEVLIQLSPAFVLGTLHARDDRRAFAARDVLPGMVTGLVLTLSLYLTGHETIVGFHAGAVAVVLNYLIVVTARALRLRRERVGSRNAIGEAAEHAA